jgi:hypothetical protein
VRRIVIIALSGIIACMLLLAGGALMSRPAPAKETAWGDLCVYPLNTPPGLCLTLPDRLPLL